MREKCKWLHWPMVGLLAASLALSGCSGDDGSMGLPGLEGQPGEPGEPGAPGQPGAPGAPGGVKSIDVFGAHERSGRVSWNVTDVEATATGAVINVNIKVDGQNRNDFDTIAQVASYIRGTNHDGYGYSAGGEGVELESRGNGNYTVTVNAPEGWGWETGTETTWRVRLDNPSGNEAIIVANATEDGNFVRNLVSDQACINCHGDNIFTNALGQPSARKDNGNPQTRREHIRSYGVGTCITCHSHQTRNNLTRYAHGIHNSSSGHLTGNNAGNITIKNNWNYSVRYPAYMGDCSACHDSQERLDAVLATPVSYELCMSCHGGSFGSDNNDPWAGFSADLPEFHLTMTAATDCTSCHNGGAAGATTGDYHSGYTNRGLAQKIAHDFFQVEIDGIERVGSTSSYEITWSVVNPQTDSAYDVCGTTPVSGLGDVTFAPVVRLAYFEPGGDDITNRGFDHANGNTGQPAGTKSLGGANSVCVDGVVTSTFTLDAQIDPEISRVLALLKPQATASDAGPLQSNGRVRIAAVSYAFDIEDGANSPRRQLVDSNKCLSCHGARLYNHGAAGGRYDNIDSCIACHNPSATDIGRRAILFDGIDASTAYDGKDAESFSFAYNMHAIHGAGATDAFYVIYRNNGIYGYGGKNTEPRNWPRDEDGNIRTYVPSGTPPFGRGPDSSAQPAHYLKQVDYPRPLMDCTACHIDGAFDLPDQTMATAISINVPAPATGNAVQEQDEAILMGPAAAACMSCHTSNDRFVRAALLDHAFRNGFKPDEFDNGKADILDLQVVETCIVCH